MPDQQQSQDGGGFSVKNFLTGLVSGVGKAALGMDAQELAQKQHQANQRAQVFGDLLSSPDVSPAAKAAAMRGLLALSNQERGGTGLAGAVEGAVKKGKQGKNQQQQPDPLDMILKLVESMPAETPQQPQQPKSSPAEGSPPPSASPGGGGAPQTPATASSVAPPLPPQGLFISPQEKAQQMAEQQRLEEQGRQTAKLEGMKSQFSEGQREFGEISKLPQDQQRMASAFAGVNLPEPPFKLAYGSEVPGDKLPPDAKDLTGAPITERGADTKYKMFQKGQDWVYEPAIQHPPTTRTKEKIQAEIDDAFQKGDKAKVKSLQDELKALDPMAQQRLQISINKEGESAASKATAEEDRQTARKDKSYQFLTGKLDNIEKPITQIADRLSRLQTTLAQGNMQADALVAPELLTVMAGGQGSGLRMNEAEIARIVGGRTVWESLKASINKWKLDPSAARSITPEQDRQIRLLVGAVAAKLSAKQDALFQARQNMDDADSVEQQRSVMERARKAIRDIDSSKPGGDTVKMKTPDGKTWDVPADKVDAAKQRGAVPVTQ